MVPFKVGYGTGTKDFVELSAVLSVTMGNSLDNELVKDEIAVSETRYLDDVTGEVLGYTLDRLLNEGAKDVSVNSRVHQKEQAGTHSQSYN